MHTCIDIYKRQRGFSILEKKIIVKITKQRFVEVLLSCVAISAFISLLCVSGPMPVASIQRDIALCACPIVFVAINVKQMRNCYYEIKHTALYYVINLCAYGIFTVVNLGAYAFFPREAYTWCFLITGFAHFSSLEVATKISIMMFHCINVATIFLAPIGMSWVHRHSEEKYVGEEMIPPRMDEEKIKAANKALEASADKHFKH